MTKCRYHLFAFGLPHWNDYTDSIGNQNRRNHSYSLLIRPAGTQQNSSSIRQQMIPYYRYKCISSYTDRGVSLPTIDRHLTHPRHDSHIDTFAPQQKYSESGPKWFQSPNN